MTAPSPEAAQVNGTSTACFTPFSVSVPRAT